MDKFSRRKAIGTIAASVFAGTATAASATSGQGSRGGHAGTMTLDDFLAMDAPDGSGRLLDRLDCKTFAQCHERMREENGVWIPELVPVFEKLDAIRAATASKPI